MSYQYRYSHYKAKMVLQLSYLYNKNPHIRKDNLCIQMGPKERPSHIGVSVMSVWLEPKPYFSRY